MVIHRAEAVVGRHSTIAGRRRDFRYLLGFSLQAEYSAVVGSLADRGLSWIEFSLVPGP